MIFLHVNWFLKECPFNYMSKQKNPAKMATTTVFNIGPHFIAREIKPFLCISCLLVFLKVNIFFQRWTLPLNKYNTYCPLWNSFNGKFKCLHEKSIMLWLILSRKKKVMKPIIRKDILCLWEQVIIITNWCQM